MIVEKEKPDMNNEKAKPRIVSKWFQKSEYLTETLIILRNAIPLAIGNLSQMLFTMMSLFFCGHIGSNELAAVALANTFINVASIAPLAGMATACDTLFPQLYGGNDKKKVGVILQKGCLISILTAIPCIGVLLNAKTLMNCISNEVDAIRLADQFLKYYSPSVFFFSQYIVISKYLQSQNIIFPVLCISLLSNIINASLQLLLVMHFNYGIIGSALSVVISNAIQVIFLISYILFKRLHKVTWPGWSYECFYDWKIYLKYGLGGAGMVIFEWAYFEIAVISTSTLGSTDISVMSITLQIIFLVSMFYTGVAYSGNIRIGYLLGENLPNESIKSAKVVISIGVISSLIISVMIFFLSWEFPFLFTNNKSVVDIAYPIIKYLSISSLLDALQAYGNAVLRTIGAQSYCMMIGFICYYVLGLPIGYLLLFKTELRVLGFWIGHSLIASILFVLQLIYIFNVNWARKAEKAHNLSLKKRKEKVKPLAIQGISVSASDPNDLASTEVITKKSYASKIIKKVLVIIIFIGIFVASILARSISTNKNYFNVQENNSTNMTNSTRLEFLARDVKNQTFFIN